MNAIQLAEKMNAKLEEIQSLADRYLKEDGDVPQDSQRVAMNIAINNLHANISGIENADVVDLEKEEQPESSYLGTRQAMAELDRSNGALTLWKVDIGEYETDDTTTPCDVYSVLVTSDNPTLAGELAEAYCVKNLGRPVQNLSIEIVEQVDEAECQEIRADIY